LEAGGHSVKMFNVPLCIHVLQQQLTRVGKCMHITDCHKAAYRTTANNDCALLCITVLHIVHICLQLLLEGTYSVMATIYSIVLPHETMSTAW